MKGRGGFAGSAARGLDVVVEGELVGMRAQRDLLELLRRLEINIRLDQVGSEDAALEQELMVCRQRAERLLQAARRLLDALALLRLHLVEVFVNRSGRLD